MFLHDFLLACEISTVRATHTRNPKHVINAKAYVIFSKKI